MQEMPLVLYADFESILIPTKDEDTTKHNVSGFSIMPKLRQDKDKTKSGENLNLYIILDQKQWKSSTQQSRTMVG